MPCGRSKMRFPAQSIVAIASSSSAQGNAAVRQDTVGDIKDGSMPAPQMQGISTREGQVLIEAAMGVDKFGEIGQRWASGRPWPNVGPASAQFV